MTMPGPPLRHWTANVRGVVFCGLNSEISRTTSVPPSTSAKDAPILTVGPNSLTDMTTTFSFCSVALMAVASTNALVVGASRLSDTVLKQPDVSKNRRNPSVAAASLARMSFWSGRHCGRQKTMAVSDAAHTGVCGAGMSCAVVVDAQPTATRRYGKSNRNRVRGIGILVIASLSSKAI